MTELTIDRPELVLYDSRRCIGTIDCRNEYNIALVTLYIFKVLYKERFECILPTLDLLLR